MGHLRRAGNALQRRVGVAVPFATAVLLGGQRALILNALLEIRQIFQLGNKPFVDFRDLVDSVHRPASFQSLKNGEQPQVIHPLQAFFQGLAAGGRTIEGIQPNFRAPDRFHDGHFKAGRDGHDLAGGFHLCPQFAGSRGEFIKRPFRNFRHDVVHRRLKTGRSLACYVVFDLVQCVS